MNIFSLLACFCCLVSVHAATESSSVLEQRMKMAILQNSQVQLMQANQQLGQLNQRKSELQNQSKKISDAKRMATTFRLNSKLKQISLREAALNSELQQLNLDIKLLRQRQAALAANTQAFHKSGQNN